MVDSKKGIYFRSEDYAGLFRRILCLAIDICFVLFLLTILNLLIGSFPQISFVRGYSIFAWLIFTIFYFTLIKSSNTRTIGYRLMGIKIIDIYGNRPSVFKMFLRFFISIFAPFELPQDILWLTDDVNKQSLRDKFSATYVIKKNAKPIGSNKVVGYYYFVHGWLFYFEEVYR